MLLLGWVQRAILIAGALALLLAAVILTYSVAVRYFFKVPTDWQDEAAAFLLIGVTFMTSAWVQSERGHVAIEAVAAITPPRWNRVRLWLCDLVSLAFCAFFTWKCWTLLGEALHEGHLSSSSWAPPLWIPYLAMALGMSLLVLQLLVQLASVRHA